MTLKELLDTYPRDQRAYVIAECCWDSDDEALAERFGLELARSGKEAAEDVLSGLVGGARNAVERAVDGKFGPVEPVSDDLRAIVETTAEAFEERLARSDAIKDEARRQRVVLKSNFVELGLCVTDQKLGAPAPAPKAAPDGARVAALPPPDRSVVRRDSIHDVIAARKSVRVWSPGSLSLPELSWLLWATQGLRAGASRPNLRTVPSGGSRHPFETYLAVRDVTGLPSGLWRYRPLTHDLVFVKELPDHEATVAAAALGQTFVGTAPVAFVWTAIPYRTEWRYATAAPKLVAQDSGHLCENLYLAATAIGCGTCGIGAYHQELMDALVGADGEDEFVVYAAPVGRRKD